MPHETPEHWAGRWSICGNDKEGGDKAGGINSGQVLAMQVDTDASTLKFWLDGKPHGPGYTSGVTGPLRWATIVDCKGNSVEIVPTPELQPWAPWEPSDSDSDPDSDLDSEDNDEEE